MGINFPASPTLNQKYPQPAVAGIPVYTWDGEKWTTVGGSVAAYAPPADAVPLMDATPGLVGTTTEYAREDHVHPTDTSRASYDAMAYSGMQINGGMEVSQELGVGGAALSGYIVDGWQTFTNGAQVVSSSQSTDVPSGFVAALANTVSTANAAPAAGNYFLIAQAIEGTRISRIAWGTASASPITIGFWVKAVRTGTYSGSVNNGDNNRSYTFTFTVNASATWEYKTVTIPGDTTGTWLTTVSVGMYLQFAMMCGTTYQTTPGAWAAGTFFAASGTTNGVAATSDVFRITGVTVLPGTQAPTAAQSPNIMRAYGEELVTCQRYWSAGFVAWEGWITSGQPWVSEMTQFPVAMRTSPTMTLVKVGGAGVGAVPAASIFGSFGAEIYIQTAAAGVASFNVDWKADARL